VPLAQEDRSSKPAWQIVPISKKKKTTKKGWWSGSRYRPSSNPSTAKKKKKENLTSMKEIEIYSSKNICIGYQGVPDNFHYLRHFTCLTK
jgi:hypothetical protein